MDFQTETRFALVTLRDRLEVIQIVDSVWFDGFGIDLIRSRSVGSAESIGGLFDR